MLAGGPEADRCSVWGVLSSAESQNAENTVTTAGRANQLNLAAYVLRRRLSMACR